MTAPSQSIEHFEFPISNDIPITARQIQEWTFILPKDSNMT